MNTELSEEDLAFRDMVHKWVNAEIPKSWARELERDEHNYPFALWDKFTAAGFHGIGIEEQYGGQGGGIITQMILARELARSLGGLSWIWGITSFAGGSRSVCTVRQSRRKNSCRKSLRESCGLRLPLRSRAAGPTYSVHYAQKQSAVMAGGYCPVRRSGAHRRMSRTTSSSSRARTAMSKSVTRE